MFLLIVPVRGIKRRFTGNTPIYNLISVAQITPLLLGDAIISSTPDLHDGSKQEKRKYGN